MTQALATTQPNDAQLARVNESELTVQDLVAQVRKVQEVMQAVMKNGEHYGVIPGTKTKPTLLKPGAEKLCLLFRLDPEYELIERVKDGDHLSITARCTLYHAPTEQRRGSGLGSCSTRESKYAYRKGERRCPKCQAEAILKSKDANEGWFCWRKKGGCGATFKPGDKSIEDQKTDRVANPDLADTYNTVLKMATKRALVAATLATTAASDIFTQDLEDLPAADDTEQPAQRRGNISPHVDADESWDDPEPPASPFDSIMGDLVDAESRTDRAQTWDEVVGIREPFGSKGRPAARVPLAIQRAKEARSINPEQYKALSKAWARIDRKLAKLEEQLKPRLEDSFRDEDERQPGDDDR